MNVSQATLTLEQLIPTVTVILITLKILPTLIKSIKKVKKEIKGDGK